MHVWKQCRESLKLEDVKFILSVLEPGKEDGGALQKLLIDPEARDAILDDVSLVDALQDRGELLTISSQLYFYLLVRHCLRFQDIGDRDVADYVAALLSQFASAERMIRPLPNDDFASTYIVDLIAALQEHGAEGRFHIHTHIANYALFLTGIFPEHIDHRRRRRGAPGIRYYEAIGQANYEVVSGLHLAGEYELREVFERLAQWFSQIRLALNDLGDRFLSFGVSDGKVLPA